MLKIDINCDLGEGMPFDHRLMELISSANIACGGHTGDANSIRTTIELALKKGVAIGAHPSYADKNNFGRVDFLNNPMSLEKIKGDLIIQLVDFQEICKEFNIEPHHIKLHGALYNRAAKDLDLAKMICLTINELGFPPVLYGLSGSLLGTVAQDYGIRFYHEVFADRTYLDDGSLTPRTHPLALMEDENSCLGQVIGMIKEGSVRSINGKQVALTADTICIHGDGVHAVEFALAVRSGLERESVVITNP